MEKIFYSSLTLSPNILSFSTCPLPLLISCQPPNRVVCPQSTPRNCLLTIGNPSAPRNGAPSLTNMFSNISNQWLHRTRCPNHLKHPQKAKTFQDLHIAGIHKALPYTYESQPTKPHGNSPQRCSRTLYPCQTRPSCHRSEVSAWSTDSFSTTAKESPW